MITYTLFLSFCDHIRRDYNAIGILIYDQFSDHILKVIGWPYYERLAVNDNDVKS